ncbi:LuxR C-terminal-related transcriptional regulator [Trichocoleus desertorum AS-A10]
MEVLKLLVKGQSNTEIAGVLYVSSNTVKTCTRGIFKKFGVDNRVQAVVFALRHGLV